MPPVIVVVVGHDYALVDKIQLSVEHVDTVATRRTVVPERHPYNHGPQGYDERRTKVATDN